MSKTYLQQYKVHFFIQPVDRNPFYEWSREVYLLLSPRSNKEIIAKALKQVGSYPKSYGAKVYMLNENLEYVERKEDIQEIQSKTNKRKRIYVDMDGVIADLNSEWVKRYNEKYNSCLTVDHLTHWDVHTLVPCGKDIYRFLDEGDLFSVLPVIGNSQEVLKKLSERYDIYIATAPFNHSNIQPKHEWLQKHFPFIEEKNYVFARDKSVLYGDYLIDDKPANLEGFSGEGLLFTAPHNKEENRFERLDNWDHVWAYFQNKDF